MTAWFDRRRLPHYAAASIFAALAVLWIALNVALVRHPVRANVPSVRVDSLADPGGSLSIDDVAHAVERFRPADLDRTQALVRWYRFALPPNGEPLVIEVSGVPDEADLYVPRDDGTFGVVSFGVRRPFAQRAFQSPEVAAIVNAHKSGGTYYLRSFGAQQSYASVAPVAFESRASYDRDVLVRESVTMGFVGFFAAMACVSLFLSLYLREPMFALHALLMGVVILWDLTEKRLSWQIVWPHASVSFSTAENVAFVLYLLTLLLFARAFLSLDRTLPAVDRTLWAIAGANALVGFAAQPMPSGAALAGMRALQFLPFVVLPAAGAVRWRQGFLQARFFVLGFAGLFLVFLTAGLIATESPLSPWAIDTGVAWECLLFQFAVADKMLAVVRERDRAQRAALLAQEELAQEQTQSLAQLAAYNDAFNHFVPHAVLEQLGHENALDVRLGESVSRDMAVLFADIRGFTQLGQTMTPDETFAFLNEYLSRIGPVVRAHGGFIDKYVGDAILALFPQSADAAVDAAIELHQAVRRFNEARARALLPSIAVGAGIHFGRVMLGTIGEELRYEATAVADAVNVASRLEELTKTFGARILVSVAVVEAMLERSEFRLRPLGSVGVRGLHRRIGVVEVCDADEPALLLHKVATLEVFESAMRAYEAQDYAASSRLFSEVVRRNADDAPAAHFSQLSEHPAQAHGTY